MFLLPLCSNCTLQGKRRDLSFSNIRSPAPCQKLSTAAGAGGPGLRCWRDLGPPEEANLQSAKRPELGFEPFAAEQESAAPLPWRDLLKEKVPVTQRPRDHKEAHNLSRNFTSSCMKSALEDVTQLEVRLMTKVGVARPPRFFCRR